MITTATFKWGSMFLRRAIVATLTLGVLIGCGQGGPTESPNPKFKDKRFPPKQEKKT